ncbi:MAG: hypothetical protein GX577_02825 [Leptolinea sp.]|nr:hypothetical protein [Leptolinea sp.]
MAEHIFSRSGEMGEAEISLRRSVTFGSAAGAGRLCTTTSVLYQLSQQTMIKSF